MRYLREPWLFRQEALAKARAGVTHVFVDEVQKIPALLDEVHGLMEKTGLRFVLTGSSARKLRTKGVNTLAGRAVTRRLHPLVIDELGVDFDLQRALRLGTLPPAVTLPEEQAQDFLRGYAETYLREEIQAEALVRNLGGFARFLDVAAAQSGQLLNYSALARDAALAVRTVQEYFAILEDTLIGFRLEPYRRSPRARLVGHAKFYLFDLGVLNALCRRLSAAADPALWGLLFEHLVVLEAHRLLDYAGSEARLFFWRTNNGAEVDLLLEKHGRLQLAVEIKSNRTISGAELSGLRSFRAHHPEVRCLVVATVPESYQMDEIEILPFSDFLGRVFPKVIE